MMHAGYLGQHGDTRAGVDCKYHALGRCAMGQKCPFRHLPEKFNSAARVAIPPGSQPQVCHFYLQGRCNKGSNCPFQHPIQEQPASARPNAQPQEDEMNIEFDEDESPQQSAQTKPAGITSPKPLPVQARLSGKLQQSAPQPTAQQPLLNRLGPQPAATSRLDGQSALQPASKRTSQKSEQDDSSHAKGSVFERLSLSRPGTALDRLSAPANRPAPAPARLRDARELLVQTVADKARVGRKEAELPRAGRKEAEVGRVGAAAGGPELEPTSISQRRMVSVNKASKAGSAQAPKFSSPIAEANGIRKSALQRLGKAGQNSTPSTSQASNPTPDPTADPPSGGRSKRPSLMPFTSTRLKASAVDTATPSNTPMPATAATPAAGATAAATPSSEQSTGGTDKRGRQKIVWPPAIASQTTEVVQEPKANVSKRKASDAASPAVEAATAAAAADKSTAEVSPAKRIKADVEVSGIQAAAEPSRVTQSQPSVQQPQRQRQQQQQQPLPNRSVGLQDAPAGDIRQQQADVGNSMHQADVGNRMQQSDATSLHVDTPSLPDAEEDIHIDGNEEDAILFDDDFDDEATMRALDALG